MAELGLLGLGGMGSAMAGRLLEAGHRVVVWNRSPSAADGLVERGAVLARTPAEAVAAADGSFSVLADDDAALGVLSVEVLGAAVGPHAVMSSLSPGAVSELAARAASTRTRLVAAPVLGRPAVAAAGQLNVLAAGAAEDIDALAPYFDVLGRRTWRFGVEPAQADVVKIAVNYTIIHALQALGEAVSLVESNGVAAADLVELLHSSLFPGVVYEGYGGMIAERRYRPAGFRAALGLKDLGLAETVARTAGFVLPSAVVLRDGFEDALADDSLADGDWAVLGEVARRLPGA